MRKLWKEKRNESWDPWISEILFFFLPTTSVTFSCALRFYVSCGWIKGAFNSTNSRSFFFLWLTQATRVVRFDEWKPRLYASFSSKEFLLALKKKEMDRGSVQIDTFHADFRFLLLPLSIFNVNAHQQPLKHNLIFPFERYLIFLFRKGFHSLSEEWIAVATTERYVTQNNFRRIFTKDILHIAKCNILSRFFFSFFFL